MFEAVAEALNDAKLATKKLDQRITRAEALGVMKRDAETYKAWWDGTDSHGSKLENFDKYIEHMSNKFKWGGALELQALAAQYKTAIVVVPTCMELEPGVYDGFRSHVKKSGVVPRVIAVRFDGMHYDWLKPVDGKWPEAIKPITGQAPRTGSNRLMASGLMPSKQ